MSKEGDVFQIEASVAKMSELVKTMIEDNDDDDEDNIPEVPLPNVKVR